MTTDVAELGIKVDSTQAIQADKALDGLADAAGKADGKVRGMSGAAKMASKSSKQLAADTSKAAKSSGAMGFRMQNASYQAADMAVQMEMGTPFIRAFGQQASQLLAVFGPYGAAAGAAVAVTAALGSTFLTSSMSASELEDKIKDLTDDFKGLTEAQRLFLADQQGDKIQEQGELLSKLAEKYRDVKDQVTSTKGVIATLTAQYEQAGMSQETIATLTAGYVKNLQDLERELRKVDGELDTEDKALADLREELMRITGSYDDMGDAIKKNVLTPAESLVNQLRMQSETLGMTAAESKLYALSLTEGVNPALIEEATLLQGTIDAYNAKAEAAKRLAAAEKEKERAGKSLAIVDASFSGEDPEIQRLLASQERKRQIIFDARNTEYISKAEYDARIIQLDEQTAEARAQIAEKLAQTQQETSLSAMASIVSITSTQLDQMQGIFDETSALGKAFYVVSQALAAGNAIIHGFQSAMAIRAAYAQMAVGAGPAAPGILSTGEAHAQVAQGMGFATAGMIAGQTISSFDGGGYTGNGSRSGGLDGKGGFMAMMHPRETVIDHTKGQGTGGTVNIEIYANDKAEVRQDGNTYKIFVGQLEGDLANGRGLFRKMEAQYGLRRGGTS